MSSEREIQAAISIADQSCSAPPKGTITGLPGLEDEAAAGDQEPDVARRVREDRGELTADTAVGEELGRRVEQHEVGRLLGSKEHDVAPEVPRRERRRPGGDAPREQAVAALLDEPRRVLELVCRCDQAGEDHLAWRSASERLGEGEQ